MMKRLTARSVKDNQAYLTKVKPNEQAVDSKYPNTLRCILESFNALANYEDLKLTPAEIAEKLKELAELREATRWIPVSEKSPPYSDLVEVKFYNGHITTDFMLSDGTWGYFNLPGTKIVAWRRTIDPPKGAGE